MRRRHRVHINEPGHAHELTFTCYQGVPFPSRDRTCEWMIESMDDARQKLDFDIWAWVLMPEHYDRNIIEPKTLLTMIDYLHNNPVRRGLVARAVDWNWSSAAWYVLMQPTPLHPDPLPPEWTTPD